MVFARQRNAGHFYSSQDRNGIHYSAGDFAARRDRLFRSLAGERALRFFARCADATRTGITHDRSTNTRVAVEESSGGDGAGSILRGRRTAPSKGRDRPRPFSAIAGGMIVPLDWSKPTRVLYVSGWFIDTMGLPIHGIRAKIGRQFFPANIDLPREDLLVTHPDLPLAARSGFAMAIPLPRGTSKLVLQYQGTDRVWRDFDSHRVRRGDRQAEVPPPSQLPFFTPHFQISLFLLGAYSR